MENKMTSTIDLEGTAVRVAMGSGSFLHGDVQEVSADSVKVKGRWFPLAAVQTEEEVEQQIKANVNTDRRLRRVEQEAKEAAELALKNGPPVLAYKPTGTETYADFTPWFSSEDYTLTVQVRPSNREAAENEYISWAGESIPEDHIREYDENGFGREWILTFPYNEAAAYPFPIVVSGTGGGLALGQAAGILFKNRVRVNYTEIIEPLVRAGLRTRS